LLTDWIARELVTITEQHALARARARAHTHTHRYTHIHTHTDTHTHIHTCKHTTHTYAHTRTTHVNMEHTQGDWVALNVMNINKQGKLFGQDYRPWFWCASMTEWQPLL